MNTYELNNCGPCNNVMCSQYGCIRKRQPLSSPTFEPMPYVPGAIPFNAQERIAELEKRVKALEEKTND